MFAPFERFLFVHTNNVGGTFYPRLVELRGKELCQVPGVVRTAVGHCGRYAVHEASRVDILRLLVRHGADLNVHDDDGQTPLHIASRHNNLQTLHELVNGGADCYAVDNLGRSAIHHAALGNAV